MWVTSLEASHHDAKRVYVAFDGHRSDDDRPWAFVSEDSGETWRELSEKLPRGSSRVLREDIENEDILYLGTEFGAWISFDRGTSWQKIGGDLPTVAVHEFSQHPTGGDVLVATHGRSLWIFDAVLLRQLTAETVEADAYLYQPKKHTNWGSTPSRGSSGTRRFVAQNPTSGIDIYYSLGKKARSITLRIEGLGGEVLRELETEDEDKRGLHRLNWDGRRQGRENSRGRRRGGRRLPAGRYLAVLEVDGKRMTQEIVIEEDPDGTAGSSFFGEQEEGVEAEGLDEG